jgi:hypothetical protein
MGQGRQSAECSTVAVICWQSETPAETVMARTAYHRAYYWSRLDARRASARASRRRARERQAIIKIICEAVTEARNDKPPFGGLTRAGGWPYSRDAKWSDAKIDRGKRSVNCPLQLLGNSGRGNNAQSYLKPTSGQPACRCAAYCREAQMALEGTNLEQK